MVHLFSAGAIFRAALCRGKRHLGDHPRVFSGPLHIGDTGCTGVCQAGRPVVVAGIGRGFHGFVYHDFRVARTHDRWRIDDFTRHQTSPD